MKQSSAVRSVSRSPMPSAAPRHKDGLQPITGGRVFVVDDDASVRKSLQRLLTSVAYRVQTFESARGFLGRPQTSEAGPQCLTAAVRMPALSGLDLHASLRSPLATLPVLS